MNKNKLKLKSKLWWTDDNQLVYKKITVPWIFTKSFRMGEIKL